MTEPENFEDDLFADLYDNDEPSAKSAPVPQQPKPSQPAPSNFEITLNEEPDLMAQDGGDNAGPVHDEGAVDDDDEIDFNLGNGPSHQDTPTFSHAAASSRGPNAKEDGKMFIGGLNWETTDQSLRDYFSQFGEVVECTVMRDGATGRSRGFGFLTFKDPKTVNIVMVKEHHLDNKIIDPKRAIPRDEQEKTSKIFVGGVSQDTTDAEFKDYFAQFGRVVDATLMMDKDTGRPRGFGFVTFESEAGVDACLSTNLEIHGKPIEVKKAQPRGNLREEEENARRGKFRKGGSVEEPSPSQQQVGNPMQNAGMTPQMMAQYFQRMQQTMMMLNQQQQQMAMQQGMPMNPMMMQQMMMMRMQQQQQMQGGGRGQGPNSPMMGMNPQIMQQMMAAQQGAGGGGGGGGSGSGDSEDGSGRPGYNAYEQQMFEQSKYQQRQHGRGGGGGGGGGARDQQYGQGQYGMGGNATSWEGMYDDPPANMQQGGGGGGMGGGRGGGFHRNRGSHQQNQGPMDPANAPPANAPTGPKNAGKPGANYRGGGRGGNRGFHPYAR